MNTKTESQSTVNETTEKLRQMGENVSQRAQDMTQTTTRYMSENPWITVAIAAATGLIIGLLVKNRD